LSKASITYLTWLKEWMDLRGIELWGGADLRDFSTPLDKKGNNYPFAISWAVPMNPQIMAGIQNGPNQAYAFEYTRVNRTINELSAALASEIETRGFRSRQLAASDRTDIKNIRGDFPHKTAATRAGLGWVGRNCQLVTHSFGPWIRLGTVFTDMYLSFGPAVEVDYCGGCMRCVDACPANAFTGNSWYPGLPRDEILDAQVCDLWKKEHYCKYNKGHMCGICSAVCPYGEKTLKKLPKKDA